MYTLKILLLYCHLNLQSPSALLEVLVADDSAFNINRFGQYLFVWFSRTTGLGSTRYYPHYQLSIKTEFSAEGPWDCGANNLK